MAENRNPLERVRDAFEAWWDEYEDKHFNSDKDKKNG